jgi:LPS-assembly protein
MQGALFRGRLAQRLIEGSYSIKAAAFSRQTPATLRIATVPQSPTANTFRGAIQTAGQFAINDKWVWGWTGLLMTDTQFLFDYKLSQFTGSFDPFRTGVAAEGVSQLYLTGAGERSYFDIRTIYYYGFSELDNQKQIPIIHPVLDYSNVLPQPVFDGELSYKFNLTSLTRQDAEFNAITQGAADQNLCASNNPAS